MMEVNLFQELFMTTTMWGYLGPMFLVIAGYVLSKRDRLLGILWFVMECLFIAQYAGLAVAEPRYYWHLFIVLFGGLMTCVYPLWDR
jgi:hypothetical protein